jgi:photosystem II stability/assembly factor-like uncharacterized protein
MQTWMLRMRALGSVCLAAAVLSACGGGGDSSPAPAPAATVIPESLGITSPATAESGAAMAFSNSAAALTGLKFQWDFGDGTSSADAAPSHTYAAGGEYDVVLKVSNEAGASRETRTKVSITNLANVRGLECSGAANTGWCWQNPRPTGNRVNAVFFLNGTIGWRAGENGEIFKTTDGGTTWMRQNSGITAAITSIRFLDESTGWAAGSYGALLRTTDGGTTWNVSKVGDGQYPGNEATGLTVVDAKTLFLGRSLSAGGNYYGTMYSSKDGGLSWQLISPLPYVITSTGKLWSWQTNVLSVSKDGGLTYATSLTAKAPVAGYYFDGTNLWVQDDQRAVAYTRATGFDNTTYRWNSVETLYITLDGGSSWSTVELPNTGNTFGLQRVLSLSADGKTLVANVNGGLSRSSDGGQTWTSFAGPTTAFYNISYATLGNGDLVATSFNGLWLSKDGGQAWTRLSNPSPTANYYSITADAVRRVATSTLTVTEPSGASYLSRDDGQTWVRVTAPSDGYSSQSSSVAFADAKNGMMIDSNGRTFGTSDGGVTWTDRSLTLGPVRMLQFANKQNGWLVASDGRLYKSADMGQTWATVPTAPGVSFASVFFQNETLGWSQRYSGGGASYASTRDGGKTWTEMVLPYGITSMRQGEQAWVAVGTAGSILVSTDTGATWKSVYTGTSVLLNAVAFSDAKTVWAVGDGTVLKSEDGGNRWAPVKVPGSSVVLRDVKFANAKVGWIVGDGGTILATQDGGKTWRPQASGAATSLTSVQVVDANTAWITGAYGLVLATGNGGN